MVSPNRRRVVRFGVFEADLETGELRRAGLRRKLAPQPFQVLEMMLERPGQLVAREELRRRLWPHNTNLEYELALKKCVNRIREVLGDSADHPHFIETLPRRGYRFIAAVEEIGEKTGSGSEYSSNGSIPAPCVPAGGDVAPNVNCSNAAENDAVPGTVPPKWRRLLLSALVATVLAPVVILDLSRQRSAKPVTSLAVLPLENLSHDPEQDYFAEGITDELITDLAKISALRVISRTSVMRYKGTKRPIQDIARELNVDAVLEGTVTRDRDRVRITAQLIRAAPEEHLWAENYEATLSGILTVQDSVANAVAHAIEIRLTRRERRVLTAPRRVDPAAYDAYLKGRYLWEHSGEENLKKSRAYLEQAIEIDPGYAEAWAGLADTYDYLASWGVLSYKDACPRARSAAEKALQLDNSLVRPLVCLARVKCQYEWDWAGAERLYKQAIDLSPNDGSAHHLYATFLAEVGRLQEAVTEARRARDLEPLSIQFNGNVIWKLYLARRYSEAELEAQKLKAWSGFGGSYASASVYMRTGRQQEAIAELKTSVERSHRGLLELMYLAHALGVTGARSEGKKVLDEMQSLSQTRYVPPMYIAIICEGLGERKQALQWFEKAVAERSINGWMLPDPRLDGIRSEPRFKDLVRRMGLPQ